MNDATSLKEIQKQWHGSFKSYLIGFTLSILLTAAAFCLVLTHLFSGPALIFTVIGLGVLQAIAQLLFFLHVGKESKPRWETLVFLFMALVVLIIVIGSLWIIYDLNNRVMSEMTDPTTKEYGI